MGKIGNDTIKGVYPVHNGRYKGYYAKYRGKYLGRFDTAEEAAMAYANAVHAYACSLIPNIAAA